MRSAICRNPGPVAAGAALMLGACATGEEVALAGRIPNIAQSLSGSVQPPGGGALLVGGNATLPGSVGQGPPAGAGPALQGAVSVGPPATAGPPAHANAPAHAGPPSSPASSPTLAVEASVTVNPTALTGPLLGAPTAPTAPVVSVDASVVTGSGNSGLGGVLDKLPPGLGGAAPPGHIKQGGK